MAHDLVTGDPTGLIASHSGAADQSGIWAYIFPIFALAMVLALIFLARFVTERLRNYLAKIRSRSGSEKNYLQILGVVPLDPKRRVSAIEVNCSEEKKLTVLVLTGGETDVCLGWIDAENNSITAPKMLHENAEAGL